MAEALIKNVDEAAFKTDVIDRSHEVPVIVDFWAEWCGPCRTLGPAIESAVRAREGDVELAKVDTDANQRIAAQFQIQSIPAVKAFRDGEVVGEFVGAVPPAAIEKFLDDLLPSEAEQLAASGDEESLRKALELDPRQAPAAGALARILLSRGETDEALEVLEPFGALDFTADGLRARIELTAEGADDLSPAFVAWDDGDYERALQGLQTSFDANPDGLHRDRIRRVMLAIFNELGTSHPVATEYRRRLAAAVN